MSKNAYSDPFGYWEVTTEGDCEGKTVRNLGVHKGYIDEIAFALADQCYYSLRFKAVNPQGLVRTPKATEVVISLDISSGTWDLSKEGQVASLVTLLKDRDVSVKPGMYYASVLLVRGKDSKSQEEAREELIRATALSKLSPEEKKALGL